MRKGVKAPRLNPPPQSRLLGWILKRRDYACITLLFMASRALLVLVGLLAIGYVPKGSYLPGLSYSGDVLNDILGTTLRYDGGWYLSIAQHGYAYSQTIATNIVFFPLYPISIWLLSRTGVSYVLSGALISNACALASSLLLFKLLRMDFGEADSKRAVLYLLVFPASFFFSAVYSESLFLLLSIAAFYFARRSNWLAAGALGGLAALSRVNGVVLFLPLACEYLDQREFGLHKVRLDSLFLLLVPAGALFFMAYCQLQFGDGLAFIHQEQLWQGRSYGTLAIFSTAKQVLRSLLFLPTTEGFNAIYAFIQSAILISALAISFASAKFLRKSYALYLVVAMLVVLMTGMLGSEFRYIAPIFPIFAALAVAGRDRRADMAITSISIALLIVFTVMFVAGYPTF